MKNIYLIVVSLILLSTLGCASTPESRPAEDTAFFLARYDKVWDTALMVLGTESIPVESYEKKKGIITTKFVNYSVGQQAHYELDTIALKPSATRLAIWSQVGYTLTILITPINAVSYTHLTLPTKRIV